MNLNNLKLLLVDDDADIVEFLSYNLKNEGFNIYKAYNGVEALKIASNINPQVVILDIMMPEMDGIETCVRMREIPSMKNSLILFFSARGEDYSVIAGYEAGGDDYIQKPIKPKVLVSRLKAMLRRFDNEEPESSNPSSNLIRFENLTIQPDRHLIVCNDREYQLPRKEFKLLTLLTSRPSRVFTRNEIFDHLWGSENGVSDRTIDVYVRKLRERIGDDKIVTVKGVGYKFAE
ncbi:MAG: response regulator transcription factor [Bacteroidales bacterium]|nr:response regulator transcription factor [Bacteroidales bacterium]